jgi:hypothetical protein
MMILGLAVVVGDIDPDLFHNRDGRGVPFVQIDSSAESFEEVTTEVSQIPSAIWLPALFSNSKKRTFDLYIEALRLYVAKWFFDVLAGSSPCIPLQ